MIKFSFYFDTQAKSLRLNFIKKISFKVNVDF